jgi:two-component system sensor histidine kinase/response regulator
MLCKDGYVVDTAVNGREMLAMTEKTKYNAVLTDGFMPLMNGWDATIELRKREKEVCDI